MPRVRVSPLGPNKQKWFMLFLLISFGGEARKLNATRMSVAADGSTEANRYLRPLAQMQTSLATWTKSR